MDKADFNHLRIRKKVFPFLSHLDQGRMGLLNKDWMMWIGDMQFYSPNFYTTWITRAWTEMFRFVPCNCTPPPLGCLKWHAASHIAKSFFDGLSDSSFFIETTETVKVHWEKEENEVEITPMFQLTWSIADNEAKTRIWLTTLIPPFEESPATSEHRWCEVVHWFWGCFKRGKLLLAVRSPHRSHLTVYPLFHARLQELSESHEIALRMLHGDTWSPEMTFDSGHVNIKSSVFYPLTVYHPDEDTRDETLHGSGYLTVRQLVHDCGFAFSKGKELQWFMISEEPRAIINPESLAGRFDHHQFSSQAWKLVIMDDCEFAAPLLRWIKRKEVQSTFFSFSFRRQCISSLTQVVGISETAFGSEFEDFTPSQFASVRLFSGNAYTLKELVTYIDSCRYRNVPVLDPVTRILWSPSLCSSIVHQYAATEEGKRVSIGGDRF